MNESAEYTRLLAQAYSKLADEHVAMIGRAQAAEARVKELLEDNARGAAYIAHLKARMAELGGAA